MKQNFNTIIKSRQEDENTKYTDSYLKAKIKHRLIKINNIDTRGDIFVEGGCWIIWVGDCPCKYKIYNPKIIDLMKEVEELIQIIDSL